jgi:hypothetical protein
MPVPPTRLPSHLAELQELGRAVPLGTRFLIRGYRSKEGRVCDFLLACADYPEVARRSLAEIEGLTPWQVVTRCGEPDVTVEIAEQALTATRREWRRAAGEGPKHYFAQPGPAFLFHLRSGWFYISGLMMGHREIEPPHPRKRPRSAASRARHWIEKQALAGRWRTLRLGRDNWCSVELGERAVTRVPDWTPPAEEGAWIYAAEPFSPPRTPPRTPGWTVDELDAALAAAGM